jgi:hypothetical protein
MFGHFDLIPRRQTQNFFGRPACFSTALAVSGLDLVIERKTNAGDRALPNFMIAATLPNKSAASVLQESF